MAKNDNKTTLFNKLRYKYKLVILNEETFEQKASFRLSRFNLYTLTGVVVILLVAIITSIIAFTPIKYYLPGVGSVDVRKQLIEMELMADSINNSLARQTFWLRNFQNLLADNIDSSYFFSDSTKDISIVDIDLMYISPEELKLREKVEYEENLSISLPQTVSKEEADKFSLLPPIEGFIVQPYSVGKNHLGIDIAGKRNEPVKSVYHGVVILADWNPETGHVIGVQHTNNMVSFYKHNSKLLKKVGSFVKKGEAIAIIGDSGELSTGPHLHFELWLEGKPLNPIDFINLPFLN